VAATAAAAAAALLLARRRRRQRARGGGGTARKPAPSDEADLMDGAEQAKGPGLDKGSSGGDGSSVAAAGSASTSPAAITPAASASRLVVLRSVTVSSPLPSTKIPWSKHPPASLATSPTAAGAAPPPPPPLGAATPVPLCEVARQLEALSSGGGISISSSGSSFGRWAAGLPGDCSSAAVVGGGGDAGTDAGYELDDLPPSLREWVIDSAAISFMRGQDGRLLELGHGARWASPAARGCSSG
jgi:hypothetical protein